MQIQHLLHRHGGRIVSIDSVAHATFKGVASWHFVGRVVWDDTTESPAAEIAPGLLCVDSSHQKESAAELNTLLETMNRYLADHGTWHEQKKVRDGRVYSWTPHLAEGSSPVTAAQIGAQPAAERARMR